MLRIRRDDFCTMEGMPKLTCLYYKPYSEKENEKRMWTKKSPLGKGDFGISATYLV
jgi:hypothetical protein